jgi:DNA-binding NtrC family response regulator
MADSHPPLVPSLLLVAGSEPVARAAERALHKTAELMLARDGQAARRLLRAQIFDVIVSDLTLPDGEGLALLGDASRLCPGARLVLFSALGPTPEAERALSEGRLSAVLSQLEELVALMRHWTNGDSK